MFKFYTIGFFIFQFEIFCYNGEIAAPGQPLLGCAIDQIAFDVYDDNTPAPSTTEASTEPSTYESSTSESSIEPSTSEPSTTTAYYTDTSTSDPYTTESSSTPPDTTWT